MHSFHHSRGRILSEAACALAVSASLAGAWVQTGASALLAAAGVTALYGLVRLLDVRRPQQAVADAPLVSAPEQVDSSSLIEASEAVEAAVPQPKAARKAKAPRKTGGRRASAPKVAAVTEIAPPEAAEVTEFAPPEEAEVAIFSPTEEVAHSHIAPLFEAEPFVRMPRPAFGRKAG